MQHYFFEIQGLTWQARASQQQDALLINQQIIQHKGLITQRHIFDLHTPWSIALADGVSQSPYATQAAHTILSLVAKASQHSSILNFSALQKQFYQHFDTSDRAFGASTTLVTLEHERDHFLNIQYLGNSRAYLYSLNDKFPKWHCLTRDHTYLEELRLQGELKAGEDYSSLYDMLTDYFCADPTHVIEHHEHREEYLTENEAIVLCSDGVHDILASHAWPDLAPDMSLKTWLMNMKDLLDQLQAYDNSSIIIARLIRQNSP